MKAGTRRLLITLFFLSTSPVFGIDNPHFYRAPYFWDEPRFTLPWLSSLTLTHGFATTHHGRNEAGKLVPLFDFIGPQNFQFLGKNLPNLDPGNPLDQLITQLAALPTNGEFGFVSYDGAFASFELIANAYQNLVNGFFMQAHLPLIRSLTISSINYTDLSPTDPSVFPNASTPIWQQFLSQLGPITHHYHLQLPTTSQATGIGDLSILVGWAGTYQNTELLDYIDVSAKIGGLFPTARRASINNPFALPLGYDGLYGLPLKFDCSIGMFDWLTLGYHQGALFLFKQKRTMRLKTASEQNGFILLPQIRAQLDPGTIWEICTYAKADHFVRGLSLQAGYTFLKKDPDTIEDLAPTAFDPIIVNKDERFQGWSMHTFHAMIEYDASTSISSWGPRCGLWVNIICGGRRIFNASLYNSSFGIDCAWCY